MDEPSNGNGTGAVLIYFAIIVIIIFVIGMCLGNWNGKRRKRRVARRLSCSIAGQVSPG